MASSSAASSAGSVWRIAPSTVVGFDLELVATALHDDHAAVELAHLDLILIEAHGLDAHDAGVWAAVRLALVQHLGLGVQGVACEERVRELDVGPAEIRDRL